MNVFAIDPGMAKSAYCVMDARTLRPLDFGILGNEELRHLIRRRNFCDCDAACIEMMQSYGNLIGKDVLESAVWIGRFYETLVRRVSNPPVMIFRMEEKMHICQNSRAGDAEIRRALIDRFCEHDFRTGRGTAKSPDFFHGFKADIWSAYAVGLTFIETKFDK